MNSIIHSSDNNVYKDIIKSTLTHTKNNENMVIYKNNRDRNVSQKGLLTEASAPDIQVRSETYSAHQLTADNCDHNGMRDTSRSIQRHGTVGTHTSVKGGLAKRGNPGKGADIRNLKNLVLQNSKENNPSSTNSTVYVQTKQNNDKPVTILPKEVTRMSSMKKSSSPIQAKKIQTKINTGRINTCRSSSPKPLSSYSNAITTNEKQPNLNIEERRSYTNRSQQVAKLRPSGTITITTTQQSSKNVNNVKRIEETNDLIQRLRQLTTANASRQSTKPSNLKKNTDSNKASTKNLARHPNPVPIECKYKEYGSQLVHPKMSKDEEIERAYQKAIQLASKLTLDIISKDKL